MTIPEWERRQRLAMRRGGHVFMWHGCWYVLYGKRGQFFIAFGVSPRHAWESFEYNVGLRD